MKTEEEIEAKITELTRDYLAVSEQLTRYVSVGVSPVAQLTLRNRAALLETKIRMLKWVLGIKSE